MSRSVTYQGYTIASSPTYDSRTGEWRLSISISWDRDGNRISRPYWIPVSYSSETEADIHGITFGQRIIDRKVPGIALEVSLGSNDNGTKENSM
jgi:hypothetical protein